MIKTYLVPVSDEVIKAMEKGEAPSFLHCATCLDGLTNGEVIQKMFPDALVTRHCIGCDSIATISLHFKSITGYEMAFSESWWNRKWGE